MASFLQTLRVLRSSRLPFVPRNYDFIGPGDDGTYDGLSTGSGIRNSSNLFNAHQGDNKNVGIPQAKNKFNAHEGVSSTLVSDNK